MLRLLVVGLILILPLAGQNSPTSLLPAGVPLLDGNTFESSGPPDSFAFRSVAPASAGESRKWEITTLRDSTPAYAIQLLAKTSVAVAKGETGLLRFRGRVTRTLHETGQGQVRVAVQRTGGNYERSALARFDLTPEWTEFHVPVRHTSDYAPGELGVFFGFGFTRQTVEIADVSLVGFGTAVPYAQIPRSRVTYSGQSPDAPWRAEAAERIERMRKGYFSVFVTDAAGAPVPAARVSVEMRRHHYEFGTAVPFYLLMDEGPDREAFRRHLFSIFNAVGPENDLKWPAWAGDGRSTRERTFAALRWLRENDVPVRGHVLIWPGAKRLPKAVAALLDTPRDVEVPALIEAHIRDITTATAGLVSEWDVLNEPYSHHQLMDRFGEAIMPGWFRAARASLGPDVPLYFNDWGNHDVASDPVHTRHFIDTARYILAGGGPIDGLGLQAHIGGVPPPPTALLATLDLYQRELGLPVRVTEFDFTTDDPELHAAYCRDFLTAYFSHPSTVGVQFWGFWEKSHWRPEAALFDADWTERPAGTAVRTLLRETWWTKLAGATDDAGRYSGRGFYGRYVVRATLGDRVVETEVGHLPGAQPTAVRLVLR